MYSEFLEMSLFITCIGGIRQEIHENENVFEQFLDNYLNLLANGCSGKLLKRYCRVMYEELGNTDYKYTKKLGNVYKELSLQYAEDIKDEAKTYLQELNKNIPHPTEFLKTMNELFTLREAMIFNDYIHDLDDFCNRISITTMRRESHRLLHDAILYPIKERLTKKERKQLEKKLKRTIKEYRT